MPPFHKKLKNKALSILELFQRRFKILIFDLTNKIKYGKDAPLFLETLWVDPREINTVIGKEEVFNATGLHRSKVSGMIVDWDGVEDPKPLDDEFRIQYCYRHWKENESWEDIGVIDFMSKTKKYGPWPVEKIRDRFKMLDKAYEETKNLGRLKPRKEIEPGNFREHDGIYVHIAKNGKPVFGGNGFHRLTMAKVLELEEIPICVGMVHKGATT
jgi:hypothetical protein